MITWILQWKLSRMARRAKPDRAFVLTFAQTLRERGYLSSRPPLMGPAWKMATATLGIVASLAVGTSSYAYMSDEVVPGHPLYAVRTEIEKVETHLAPTPTLKQQINIRHVERRLKEAKILARRHQPLPPFHAKLLTEQKLRGKIFFGKNGNVLFSSLEATTSGVIPPVAPSQAEPSSEDENSDRGRSARRLRKEERTKERDFLKAVDHLRTRSPRRNRGD